jgi:hypothetical protein
MAACDIREIEVNDGLMPIGKNLWNFLRTASHHSELSEQRQFWIDQIVIDQANIEERNHQVMQMAEIYRSAKEVLIWLGLEPESFEVLGRPYFEILAFKISQARADPDERVIPMTRQHIFLEALGSSYWSRQWVRQELLLARSIKLQWGDGQLSWIDFIHAANSFKAVFPRPSENENYIFISFIEQMRIERISGIGATFGLNWRQVLYFCRNTECADPRDKIYAMLGVVNARVTISPNYNLRLEEVVIQMLRAQATDEEALNVDLPSLAQGWISELQIGSLSGTSIMMVVNRLLQSREHLREQMDHYSY